MLKNEPKKIADQVEFEIIKEDKDKPAVIVGPAYGFLFEGENNDYDDEYKDFI
jgi:hypothetical protein